MNLNAIDPPTAVAYHCYTTLRSFRPPGPGSIAGGAFEDHVRACLAAAYPAARLGGRHDLGLGAGLASRSGLAHELDLVLRLGSDLFVGELKYLPAGDLTKEMLMIFHGKVVDFYLEHSTTLDEYRLHRLILTAPRHIPLGLRRYAAGWGILLLDPLVLPPMIASLVVADIAAATAGPAASPWARPARFALLTAQAAALSARLWRPLHTIYQTLPALPAGLWLDRTAVPGATTTATWIAAQVRLAGQVRQLQAQYRAWQEGGHRG